MNSAWPGRAVEMRCSLSSSWMPALPRPPEITMSASNWPTLHMQQRVLTTRCHSGKASLNFPVPANALKQVLQLTRWTS